MKENSGYNLVEVLVTLTIASIITITLVNFVNDVDMRHKVAIARADVNRISEAAHLAEADPAVPQGSSLTVLNLSTSSRLAWGLGSRLLEVPTVDPWGNRFIRTESSNGSVSYIRATAAVDVTTASPYIIDEGLGRVISAGPDGIVDTKVGQDPADSESDIVVEYRHKPWLFYNTGGKMYVNSADGAASPTGTAGIEMGEGTNAQVSSDGLRFAAVIAGNTLQVGTLAWAAGIEGVAPTPRTEPILVAPRTRTLKFSQNSWVSDSTPLAVGADTIPVWLPDSSGIVFVTAAGRLYRWDPARGGDQARTGEVIQLTGEDLIDISTGGGSGQRAVATTRRGATYVDPDLGIYLVISGDGKVAFKSKLGLTMALGDGTSRRLLKSGNFIPIAWIDNNNIAYLDKANNRIWRIAQDGTIDLPLHPKGQPDVNAVHSPCLSTDGKYLAFLESASKGYVAKTDGTGFVTRDSSHWDFGDDLLLSPRLVWKQGADEAKFRLFYLPSKESTRPVKVMQIDQKDAFHQQNAVSVSDPEDSLGSESSQAVLLEGLNCRAFDLSRDEKMIAVLSDTDSTKRPSRSGGGGVYVIPLTGKSKAMTKITPATPPNSAGYNYVSWLLN